MAGDFGSQENMERNLVEKKKNAKKVGSEIINTISISVAVALISKQ